MKRKVLNFLAIFAMTLFVSSCEKSQSTRTYSEVTVDSSESMSMTNGMSDLHAAMDVGPNGMMPDMGNKDPHAGFTKEQLAQMLSASGVQNVSQSPLQWTLPQTWQQKPATGMRIATFASKNDPNAFDCSIVALGAGAGGLEPNIIRWIGQLNMAVPSEKELNDFIQKQEKVSLGDNLSALLVDFTSLQKNSDNKTPSMLAAIIETPAQRIFVKMTGSKQRVLEESKTFKAFVKSLKFKN